jgi:hypothetical protein
VPSTQPNIDRMWNKRNELERFVEEQLTTLISQRGLIPAPTEREGIWTTYYLTHGALGFQITLDYPEEFIYMYILRLSDGNVPQHGFIVDGEVVREDLLIALREILQVKDEQIEALRPLLRGNNLDYSTATLVIQSWRELIERYLDFLEAQPLEVIFPSVEDFKHAQAAWRVS